MCNNLEESFAFVFRSDAQRSAKQKERKERELEHCAFNAEHMEDGGFPLQLVSFCACAVGPTFTHSLKERKERELEHCAFNAEHMEDGGFPLQMVSFAHAQ